MSIIYNNKLKDILRKASTVLQGAQLIYVDVFTPLYDFILSPNKYGEYMISFLYLTINANLI